MTKNREIKGRIKIGKKNYQVVEVDEVTPKDRNDKRVKAGTHYFAGFIDYGKKIIEINKKMDWKNKKNTFFHEIAHGIIFELGKVYKLGRFKCLDTNKLRNNEEFIDDLSRIMCDVFKVKWKKENNGLKKTKRG